MEFIANISHYLLVFVVGLSLLVFVHEFGHYIVARWCKVRVEVFSIGFGPEIRGLTDKAGTRWKFSAIPLGGYVKMFGERDGLVEENGETRDMTEDEKAVSFQNKSLAKRAAVVAAGPIANFLFAIIVFALMFIVVGNPRLLAVIGAVQEQSAAAEAGIQVGDRLLEIDNQPVKWFDDLRHIVADNAGKELTIVILRNGQTISLTATPKPHQVGDQSTGLLGVSPDRNQVETVRYGPVDATLLALERCWDLTVQILSAIGQIFSGERDSKELGGPLMIAKVLGDVAHLGLNQLIFILAIFSLNLGLINLFPIPILDGGHLVYYAIEAILGRPLDERAQEYGFRFGLILVLALMIFATWNDFVNLKIVQFFTDLVT